MKRLIGILWIVMLVIFPISNSYASNEETIQEQQQEFGIQDFLKSSEQYTGEFFEDVDIGEILEDAIKGEVDNSSLAKRVLNLLGSEVITSMKAIGSILAIIVIHSILKSLSESLENENISKLIYYAQYILIITIIMTNFSDIVKMVQDTTVNLVAFMNMLVPLLITLMVSTGSIATSSVIEPIILFMINFIGNMIRDIIIPLIMIFTSLVVISKLTDKIKIDKLSNFLKSGIVWFLGIILTIFVGVVSLEGTMSSSVDRNYSKNYKSSCQFSYSSSRKDIRRCGRYSTWLWNYFKECGGISWCCYYYRNLHYANFEISNINLCIQAAGRSYTAFSRG